MKNLIETIKACVVAPDFVERFRNNSVRMGAKHIYRVALLLAIIMVFGFAVMVLPKFLSFSPDHFISEKYPQGLEVTVTDGVVTTNVEEPYFIVNPEKKDAKDNANFLVIDTHVTDPLEAMDRYDTMVLLTSNRLIFEEKEGTQTRMLNLAEMKIKNLQITESTVLEFVRKVKPYLYVGALVMMLLMPFLIAGGILVSTMIAMLFYACATWIFGKVRGLGFTYTQSYVLSLYLVTAPLIVTTFLGFFVPRTGWLKFLFFLVLAVFLLKQSLNGENTEQPLTTESAVLPEETGVQS